MSRPALALSLPLPLSLLHSKLFNRLFSLASRWCTPPAPPAPLPLIPVSPNLPASRWNPQPSGRQLAQCHWLAHLRALMQASRSLKLRSTRPSSPRPDLHLQPFRHLFLPLSQSSPSFRCHRAPEPLTYFPFTERSCSHRGSVSLASCTHFLTPPLPPASCPLQTGSPRAVARQMLCSNF